MNYWYQKSLRRTGKSFIFIAVFLFLNQFAFAQTGCKASFSDTVIYTCSTGIVKIKNLWTDTNSYVFYWNFGDGRPESRAVSPQRYYKWSGTYRIREYMTNGKCYDSAVKYVTIKIENPPVAGLKIDHTYGCPPFTVKMEDTGANSFSREWYIDGVRSADTGVSVSHVFSGSGAHLIGLTSYNHQGCAASASQYVNVVDKPVPSFTYTTKKVCNGLLVYFQNSSKNSSTYNWNFGDGYTSQLINPSHIYRSTGNYKITLTAYNQGCASVIVKDSIPIQIPVDSVTVDFTGQPRTDCNGTVTRFQDLSKNSIGRKWYFGDGDTDTSRNPTHQYRYGGKFTVSLVEISNLGCRDSVVKKDYIEKVQKPMPGFSIISTTLSCGTETVTIKNNSRYADSFAWDFGDQSSILITRSLSTNAVHKYQVSGNYTVTLTAMKGNCTTSASWPLTIETGGNPVAKFAPKETQFCINNATVIFENLSTNGYWYLWDFGDSVTATDIPGVHTYKRPGHYTVKLTAKAQDGCTSSYTCNDCIKVYDTVRAEIIPSITNGCSPLNVNFAAAHDPADTGAVYYWDFDDGKSSVGYTANNNFDRAKKKYHVTLWVDNGPCTETAETWITVDNFDTTSIPAITLVTVVDNRYVKLEWTRNGAVSFDVYRSVDGSNYNLAGSVTDTFFNDYDADFTNRSYWYKVKWHDKCGTASLMSSATRTIFLQALASKGNDFALLNWNTYSGFETKPDYSLFRDGEKIIESQVDLHYSDNQFYREATAGRSYFVSASANGLVSNSNSVFLEYQPYIFIPDAFSPNGDGLNDKFEIKSTGVVSYSLSIFNRFGNRVYQTENYDNSWNGTFNGEWLAPGVYVYLVEGRLNGNKTMKKEGTFMVVYKF